MSVQVYGCNHVAIEVGDIEKAVAFYEDVFGLKKVNPSLGPNARVSSMALVPVGSGHIDWKPIFAQAQLAGLKHFCIEQDNAAAWGDSMAAARVSYRSLAATLDELK